MCVNCASRKCVCFNLFPCAVSSVREPVGWCKQGRSSNNPRPRCQDLASTRHWAMYHLLMITGYLLHSITHKFQRRNSLSLWRQFRAALCRDDALHTNWDDSDPLGSLPGWNWSILRSCCCLHMCQPSQEAVTYYHVPVLFRRARAFLKAKQIQLRLSVMAHCLADPPCHIRPPLAFSSYLSCSVLLSLTHVHVTATFLSRVSLSLSSRTLYHVLRHLECLVVCPTQLPLCFTDWAKHMTRMDPSTWPSYPCFRRGGVRSGWDGHRLLSLFQTRTQAQWNPLFKV